MTQEIQITETTEPEGHAFTAVLSDGKTYWCGYKHSASIERVRELARRRFEKAEQMIAAGPQLP